MQTVRYLALCGLALIGLVASSATACSVCHCGDDGCRFSQQPLAPQGLSATGRFQISLAHVYSSKSNALSPDEGVGTESQREFRPSLRTSYQAAREFSFSVELPLTVRRLSIASEEESSVERSTGVGDLELAAVWKHDLTSERASQYSIGLSGALKVPSGRNNLTSDGERLEEHLQAGTGSFDYTLGGGLSRTAATSRIFVSAYYRQNGTNDFEYRYGHATLMNVGGQLTLGRGLQGTLEFNARYAQRDTDDDELVANSGGWVGYITPGARLELRPVVSLSLSVQIPIWQDLHGDQTEKAVLSTSVGVSL